MAMVLLPEHITLRKFLFIFRCHLLLIITILLLAWVQISIHAYDDYVKWDESSPARWANFVLFLVFFVQFIHVLLLFIATLWKRFIRKDKVSRPWSRLASHGLVFLLCLVNIQVNVDKDLNERTNRLYRFIVHSESPLGPWGKPVDVIPVTSEKYDQVVLFGMGRYGRGIIGLKDGKVVSRFLIPRSSRHGYVINQKAWYDPRFPLQDVFKRINLDAGTITAEDFDETKEMIRIFNEHQREMDGFNSSLLHLKLEFDEIIASKVGFKEESQTGQEH